MSGFLSQSTGIQVAIIAAIVGAISLLVGILQYFQSRRAQKTLKESPDVNQSVEGSSNNVVQVGKDNSGDINIK